MTEGERLRDAALGRVEANADSVWMAAALRAGRSIASRQVTLTTDDIWADLGFRGLDTREHRAMGAVVRMLVKAGVLAHSGRYTKSVRQECHARPIPVWRSSVYVGKKCPG